MTRLSEKLGDLCARVGDIEARAEAFQPEKKELRAAKVEALRRTVRAQRDDIHAAVYGKTDEIASAWNRLNCAAQASAGAVRTAIVAQEDAVEATQANDRADRMEFNAAMALDHALVAVDEAELAVAEAIDARLTAERPGEAVA